MFPCTRILAECRAANLHHRHPAIDGEGVADHVARAGAAEPEHGRGDLLGPARAADGDVLRDLGVRLLVPADDVAGDLRVDQAGIDRVHADAVLDVFQAGRPRQADHAVLRGDVGADAGIAGQRTDRRVVDDRAAALAFHLPQFVLHAAPHAAQVDPDDAVPFLAGAVGGRGDPGHDARVVERGVEPAELGDGAVHHRATWASSLTSQRTAIALWPAATNFSAAAFTTSSLKSASTTAAPASANACAVASPMPAAAPVTSATLPLKSNGLLLMVECLFLPDMVACSQDSIVTLSALPNVLQAVMSPDFRPRVNQSIRWAEEPWVKLSGLT